MSRYHRHFKLVASDIGEIAAEWPDRVGWPFIFEYGEHTQRLHANARMSYHSVIAKLKAETDAPPGFEDARNKWYENPDAILPNEGWWPLSNVYIPTREDNPVFEEAVEEYMHMPKPAVIGVTSSHPGAADQKLTTDPPNSDYSFLFVEDGVHRSIAAAREGIGWIRATMQARPSASLSGGYEPINTSRD